jgi:hypothetical protein
VGRPIESLEIPIEFDEMLGPYDAAQNERAEASEVEP